MLGFVSTSPAPLSMILGVKDRMLTFTSPLLFEGSNSTCKTATFSRFSLYAIDERGHYFPTLRSVLAVDRSCVPIPISRTDTLAKGREGRKEEELDERKMLP